MASVKSLTSYLPSGAADVYYRDVIGQSGEGCVFRHGHFCHQYRRDFLVFISFPCAAPPPLLPLPYIAGNISTSNFHVNDDGDHVFEMRPRFPLFGA